MAKTSSLSFSLGRKVSDGDYGSLDFHVSETIDLAPQDDPNEEFLKLEKRVVRKFNRLKKQAYTSLGK